MLPAPARDDMILVQGKSNERYSARQHASLAY
jgi:hypothetical protein